MPSRASISTRFAVFVIILGALALRCAAIDRFSLDNDEVMEILWSRLPWKDLLAAVGHEGAHPPLEHLVQAGIGRLGAPDSIRRVPSVVAGVATVGLVLFLGLRWFGVVGGLAAGILLACAPVHVRFSQEIRPYALGLFFLTASVAALEEYRRRPSKLIRATWFGSVLAAAYTLYFAGLIAGLVSVLFIFTYRREGLRPLWRTLPLSLLFWLLLYIPWLPYVVSVAQRAPPVGREVLDRAWWSYRLQALATGDWQVESISAGSWVFWFLVLLGLGLAWRSRPARLAGLWLLLGGTLQILILQFRPHYPAARHLLPSLLAAPLLAGYAVSLLWQQRSLRAVGPLAMLVVLFFDGKTLLAYYDHGRPRWNAVASHLRNRVRPGERLIVPNNWTLRNLGYYWNDGLLGRSGVRIERAWDEVVGPSWIVIAVCPMRPEVRAQIDRLELSGSFPTTNHCEVRFLPKGQSLTIPDGMCVNTE